MRKREAIARVVKNLEEIVHHSTRRYTLRETDRFKFWTHTPANEQSDTCVCISRVLRRQCSEVRDVESARLPGPTYISATFADRWSRSELRAHTSVRQGILYSCSIVPKTKPMSDKRERGKLGRPNETGRAFLKDRRLVLPCLPLHPLCLLPRVPSVRVPRAETNTEIHCN